MNVLKDKKLFKQACREYGVSVVREYARKEDVETFPVIVKPVDRGGSIGVSVAKNHEELEKAFIYAMKTSYSKQVIIEDFISWGNKFDVYYVITNGEVTFLSSSDTINAHENGFDKVVQSGWTLPSQFEKQFIAKANEAIKNMILGLGIRDGFIFFSGFSDGERFVFFETGFRLSGSHMYRYFEANGLPDIQDIFIQHALTGNCDDINFAKVKLSKKALIINFYAKDGMLSELSGIKEIERIPECGYAIPMCRIGTVCRQDKAILNKLGMVHLYSEDKKRLQEDLKLVNQMFRARDENGKDMVYDRLSWEDVKF